MAGDGWVLSAIMDVRAPHGASELFAVPESSTASLGTFNRRESLMTPSCDQREWSAKVMSSFRIRTRIQIHLVESGSAEKASTRISLSPARIPWTSGMLTNCPAGIGSLRSSRTWLSAPPSKTHQKRFGLKFETVWRSSKCQRDIDGVLSGRLNALGSADSWWWQGENAGNHWYRRHRTNNDGSCSDG